MSRLICSSPALHELSIGSGSSHLTDRLTEKVLQQAVPQTWKGKVLRVESSSPATLKQAFASSQKLSSAKSQVILDSLHLIHYPSGNTVGTYLYSTHFMYIYQCIGNSDLYPSMWVYAYFEYHVIRSFFNFVMRMFIGNMHWKSIPCWEYLMACS